MKRYSISFRYSRDGKSWTRTSTSVTASSDSGAIAQIKLLANTKQTKSLSR